jgi:hypothetical protein
MDEANIAATPGSAGTRRYSGPDSSLPRRRLVAGLLLLALIGRQVCAHGLVASPSTPMSPPAGFLWVPPAWAAVLILANAAYLRRRRIAGWGEAILAGAAVAALFGLILLAVGLVLRIVTNDLLPAPWWGSRACYGLGWSGGALVLFGVWNGIGLLILRSVVTRQIARSYRLSDPDRRLVQKMNAAVYLVALLPFLFAGALVHGWAGGHLHIGCRARIADLGHGLLEYALAHDGRLPEGETMDEVLVQIRPHLDPRVRERGEPIHVCPVCAIYDRDPDTYAWNASMAGRELSELADLRKSEPLVSCACPYHRGAALTVGDIVRVMGSDEPEVWPTGRAN